MPDGIPVIVPQDLFDRVQEKLAKNKKAPARHKAEDDYLLTTKLFCGYCGAYLCGESGTSHTGNVHHYYKCVSVKKKRTECHKKSVRKEWIEDLVVSETMRMVMDDKAIEAIVSMLMDLQDRENVNLPLYEQQLREADTAIQNLLNAIQQGILTKSTKGRLEELEATKEELETKIACEKLAKPKVSAEFMTFWLHRFRKLDVRQKSHRKMLIDTFINAIFLYDDKMVITFNYKEGTTTITFDDLKTALADQKTGSDLDCSTAPKAQSRKALGFLLRRKGLADGPPKRRQNKNPALSHRKSAGTKRRRRSAQLLPLALEEQPGDAGHQGRADQGHQDRGGSAQQLDVLGGAHQERAHGTDAHDQIPGLALGEQQRAQPCDGHYGDGHGQPAAFGQIESGGAHAEHQCEPQPDLCCFFHKTNPPMIDREWGCGVSPAGHRGAAQRAAAGPFGAAPAGSAAPGRSGRPSAAGPSQKIPGG